MEPEYVYLIAFYIRLIKTYFKRSRSVVILEMLNLKFMSIDFYFIYSKNKALIACKYLFNSVVLTCISMWPSSIEEKSIISFIFDNKNIQLWYIIFR